MLLAYRVMVATLEGSKGASAIDSINVVIAIIPKVELIYIFNLRS